MRLPPWCNPSACQKSDFFKMTFICFLCIVIVHQWNLAEITARLGTRDASDTARKPGRRPVRFDRLSSIRHDIDNWSESAKVRIYDRRFVSSERSRVFILGAVAKNSTPTAHWDKIAIYGQWYDHALVNESNIRCCYRYSDGSMSEHPYAEFNAKNYKEGMLKATLMLWHITCDSPPTPPKWVSIARYDTCYSGIVSFVRPFYAMRQPPGHLVITTKMAYRHIEPETIIGFLEAARYYGVNKVITYVMDNLDPVLKKIMRYYAYLGVLDYYTIELAQSNKVFRRFPPSSDAQYRCDEWIVKRDALERSMGSEFFGIFDMDEYLIPSRNRSYKELLHDLRNNYPNTSHFFFRNIHYFTDVNADDPTCSPNCSIFRRHIWSSPVRFNSIHEKMILITTRVVTSTVTNHRIRSMKPYHRSTCPSSEAYLGHYGSCKRKFSPLICLNESTWVHDTGMVEWAEDSGVLNNIQNAHALLQV